MNKKELMEKQNGMIQGEVSLWATCAFMTGFTVFMVVFTEYLFNGIRGLVITSLMSSVLFFLFVSACDASSKRKETLNNDKNEIVSAEVYAWAMCALVLGVAVFASVFFTEKLFKSETVFESLINVVAFVLIVVAYRIARAETSERKREFKL